MNTHPDINTLFDFFKIFDSQETISELRKELVYEACDEFKNFVKGFSCETGFVEVEYYDHITGEFGTSHYSAMDDILVLINKKVRDIKNEIDSLLSSALVYGSDIQTYLLNFSTILTALAKRDFFPFEQRELIYKGIGDIAQHIKVNYDFDSGYNYQRKPYMRSVGNYHSLSYRWNSLEDEAGLLSLKKLFKLLTMEPKIIDCSENEFIDAFTQSKVNTGIRWCVIGKNGQYSKQSLLSFIEYLMSNKFIETKTNDFNKALCYVFRTNTGEPIKNLSVSKSSSTSVPSEWERILAILGKI